jgi:hypothetical protein
MQKAELRAAVQYVTLIYPSECYGVVSDFEFVFCVIIDYFFLYFTVLYQFQSLKVMVK